MSFLKNFNPNGAAEKDAGIFGLPFTRTQSKLVILPVSWEATTSYGEGTSRGPQAILKASHQVDLLDHDFGRFYEQGIFMEPIESWIQELSDEMKSKAVTEAAMNEAGARVNDWVEAQTRALRSAGYKVGILGGDHSTPFGAIKALAEEHKGLGILHIDAHADLRKSFEGFEWSHASIMYNVIQKTAVQSIVQVGIRDYCEEELALIQEDKKIQTFFDRDLAQASSKGRPWSEICKEVIGALPHVVYVSFDIDGLDPTLCPHTGTPVPGGLSYNQAVDLLVTLKKSGKVVAGFDLNEVSLGPAQTATSDWDANVGARILFKLCGVMLL